MTQSFEEERWYRGPLDTRDAKAEVTGLDRTDEFQTPREVPEHQRKPQEALRCLDKIENEKAPLTLLEEETHAELDRREFIADTGAAVSKEDLATGLERIVDAEIEIGGSKEESCKRLGLPLHSTGVDRDESNGSMNGSKGGCHGHIPPVRASSCYAIMGHSSRRDTSQTQHAEKRRRHSWHGSSTSSIASGEYSENRGLVDTKAGDSSAFRKAWVAITGSTLVVVGLVMIPLPTPGGFIVATAGMMHLGQEFPAAQRILNATKERVMGAFQRTQKNESESKKPSEEQVKKEEQDH